jgi:hypothetical protein
MTLLPRRTGTSLQRFGCLHRSTEPTNQLAEVIGRQVMRPQRAANVLPPRLNNSEGDPVR